MSAKEAAAALAELYVFAAVEQLMEGTTAPRSRSGQRAADRIITICKAEGQKRLREYDAALDKPGQQEGR